MKLRYSAVSHRRARLGFLAKTYSFHVTVSSCFWSPRESKFSLAAALGLVSLLWLCSFPLTRELSPHGWTLLQTSAGVYSHHPFPTAEFPTMPLTVRKLPFCHPFLSPNTCIYFLPHSGPNTNRP